MKPATYSKLRLIHRWLGLSVGLLLVVQGLTGAFMAFIPQFDRMINPGFAASYNPATTQPLPQIAEGVWKARHDKYQGVGVNLASGVPTLMLGFWPQPDPFLPGEIEFRIARIHPTTGAILAEALYGAFPTESLMVPVYIHSWHTTLTSGALGRFTLIGSSLFLLLSILLGVRIWWPGRRRLRQQLSVASVDRNRWAQTLHRFVAPYAAVVLGLLLITGVALQFVITIDPIYAAKSSQPAGRPQINPLRAWQSAERMFPGAKPLQLGAPFTPSGVFRVELEPVVGPLAGDSVELFVDNYSGEVLRVRDRATASPLEKVLGLLAPLHGGSILGTTGHVLAFIAGFLPLLLLITGVRRWREVSSSRRRQTKTSS